MLYAVYPFILLIARTNMHVLASDGLAIYLLNLLLAFLQPRFDPSLEEDLLADEIEEGAGEEETACAETEGGGSGFYH